MGFTVKSIKDDKNLWDFMSHLSNLSTEFAVEVIR